MNILFITSSRIGDAVLSTGLLSHIEQTWPQASVTIVCGPLVASLFEGYPRLKRIIPLKKRKYNMHWLALWQEVAPVRWDMVIDLRNSMVSRMLRSDRLFVMNGRINKKQHKVQQNAAVMHLAPPPAPRLWFSKTQSDEALKLIPVAFGLAARVLAVGPAANWAAKTWPAERFIEVIAKITAQDGLLPGARVAVFAAPGEEQVARQVLESVPAARRIDMIARADPGAAAAALARCALYIGNDSGLMHCAAAAGVPTMGLFGPSYPQIYGPWGDHCAYARTPETFDELIAYPGFTPKTAPCLMTSLSVAMVMEKIKGFQLKQN
jgi:lipopolysaccharide export system permease protein